MLLVLLFTNNELNKYLQTIYYGSLFLFSYSKYSKRERNVLNNVKENDIPGDL